MNDKTNSDMDTSEDALKAFAHIDEVQALLSKKKRSEKPENTDQILIGAIQTLFNKHNLPIIAIKKILNKVGISENKVSKMIEAINKLEKETNEISTYKLLFKKPLIVPPGLNPAVMDFEAHFAVSGEEPIMILGSTGVGKSLFLYLAKRLFKKAHQNKEIVPPVVEANCAHFAGGSSGLDLARSELFGHVEGAFTGAIRDKKGLVEKADGGMLILEEVGELPLEVQAMLLTFIETGGYRRVGDENSRKATVKIVAATNRESALRADFRYRFFSYYIRPLHERKQDILYYFYELFPDLTKKFTKSEVLLLLSYNWPGNVREIERVGKLLMRKKWNDDRTTSNDPDFKTDLLTQRLYHLDPKDISFDPAIVGSVADNLEDWGIDIHFLSSLFKKDRISLDEDDVAPAFDELIKDKTDYFSWNDEFALKFCDEYMPFSEAYYKGYLAFCGLFLQSPDKDNDILNNLHDCSIGNFSLDRIEYPKSSELKIKSVVRSIMKYLLRIRGEDHKLPEDFRECWQILSEIAEMEGVNISGDPFEDAELCNTIAQLREKDLITAYYQILLKRSGGNVVSAARMADVNEKTFRSRLGKHGLLNKKNNMTGDVSNIKIK